MCMKIQNILIGILFLLVFSSSAHAAGVVLWEQDFNAGNYNGLTVSSGTWTAASFYLEGGGADNASIYRLQNFNNATLAADQNYQLEYDSYILDSPFGDVVYLATSPNASVTHGYRTYSSTPNCGWGRQNAAATYTFACSAGVWFNIRTTWNNAGTYTTYKNGVAVGTVTDTTYTDGNHMYISSFNGTPGQNQRWDNFRLTLCSAGSCALTPSTTMDANINYPNTLNLAITGAHDFNVTFTDSNFTSDKKYDINIAVHRQITGASTTVVNDLNAYTVCSNMDSNTSVKTCLYSYNFSQFLTPDVNYLADVNISNGFQQLNKTASFAFYVPSLKLSVDYNGFGTDPNTGRKYVNTLNYDVNSTCYSGGTGILQRFINSLNDFNQNVPCNSSPNHTYNSYQHSPNGGNFLIHFLLSDPNAGQTTSTSDLNFYSDTVSPVATLTNTPLNSGFGPTIGDVNLNLRCVDTVSPLVDYNIVKLSTDTNYLTGQFDANTTQTATIPLNSVTETFKGQCTDLAGNTDVDFNVVSIQANCFQLVDETLGTVLSTVDINGFGGLTATSYLTSDVYNFKNTLQNTICFNGSNGDTIRFDMNYSDGTQLFREFNQDILESYDQNIPVCIADQQSFFEQDFTSAKNTPIILRHQLSHCYNMADYTKYAEADALSARAFTIVGPYIMETFDDDGNKVVLAQINGGTPSSIQVDFLKFKIDSVPLNVVDDYLGISLYLTGGAIDSNTLKFSYVNFKNDNIATRISVADNNGVIFDYNEFSNPNLFVVYFDHTLVPIDGNILTVTITKTKEGGGSEVETKYFSLQGIIKGAKGIFGSGEAVGVMVAVIVFIFMFTLAAPKYALGWVGILASLISLVILTLTSQAWYVILLQAIFLTIAIYLSIQYKDVHAGVT